MEKELTVADYAYSVKIGSVMGFLVGWAIGVGLILYLNSPALNSWWGVASIPLWNGFGWMFFGFIVGGGGFFANVGRATKPALPATMTATRHAA